jgi:hypothetical protein
MGNQLRKNCQHTGVVPHHGHHATPLHGRHCHCCSSRPRPSIIIALSIFAPAPHFLQSKISTTPTQQHLPPRHFTTQQPNNLPTPAPLPRVIPSPTPPQFTSLAAPESAKDHIHQSLHKSRIQHPLIIYEGGANDHSRNSKTHHLGTLRYRRHSSYRHLPNHHNKPRPTSPLRHHRSEERH